MSLIEAVLAAQREREKVAELGTTEPRYCRLPTCRKALHTKNTTGFCRNCQCNGAGRRWYRMMVRPDLIAHTREWGRRWRKERFAAGLCSQCTGQRVPDGKRCAACIEKDRAGSKADRTARTKAGICWYCSSEATPGKKRCRKHLAIDAARVAKRRADTAKKDRARVRELLAQIPGRAA